MSKKFDWSKQKGQGLGEYILILALVALVVVFILALLGPAMGNILNKMYTSQKYEVATYCTESKTTCVTEWAMIDSEFVDCQHKESVTMNDNLYFYVAGSCHIRTERVPLPTATPTPRE